MFPIGTLALYARWLARRARTFGPPSYFIRVCPQFSRALKIIQTARTAKFHWPSELVTEVVEWILDPKEVELSMYESPHADRYSPCHAMAVIAATIGVSSLGKKARDNYLNKLKDASNKKGGKKTDLLARAAATLIIPRAVLAPHAAVRFTPEHNTTFSPAADAHYDIVLRDRNALATAILNAIADETIEIGLLNKTAYTVQAGIALAQCIHRFGDLNAQRPPSAWQASQSLEPQEQLTRLRFAAGDQGFIGRPECHISNGA